jgi:ATP-binding cassette subfamily F protein uup
LLGDGRITHLPGGIDEYLTRYRPAPAQVAAPPAATGPTPAAQLRTARKELARLERQIERLAGREAELQQRIIQQAADPAAFRELEGELREVLAAKDDLETRWLEVAEAAG